MSNMKGFSEDWTETSPNLWELKKELEGRPKKRGEAVSTRDKFLFTVKKRELFDQLHIY